MTLAWAQHPQRYAGRAHPHDAHAQHGATHLPPSFVPSSITNTNSPGTRALVRVGELGRGPTKISAPPPPGLLLQAHGANLNETRRRRRKTQGRRDADALPAHRVSRTLLLLRSLAICTTVEAYGIRASSIHARDHSEMR